MTADDASPDKVDIQLQDIKNSNENVADDKAEIELKVYKRRWVILIVVALLNNTNTMSWIAFAPISNLVNSFYGGQSASWFSLIYMMCTIPVGFFAMWAGRRFGLRSAILIAGWTNGIGGLLRLISSYVSEDLRFPIGITGQAIAAVAYPFIMFLPTKVAGSWFPDTQRALATTIGVMSNPLGVFMANVISPAIAKTPEQVPLINIFTFVPSFAVMILATIAVNRSEPKIPPTFSASKPQLDFLPGLKSCLTSFQYIVLLVVMGGGIGMFNCLYTVLQGLLCPSGYSNTFGGWCAGLMILGGLFGATASGIFVDKTKLYEQTMKIAMGSAVAVGLVFMQLTLRVEVAPFIAITCLVFGVLGLATYPVGLELASECTYPASEATSTGLIVLSGQVQSVIYVLIMKNFAKPLPDDLESVQTCRATPEDKNNVPMDNTAKRRSFDYFALAGRVFHCKFGVFLLAFLFSQLRKMFIDILIFLSSKLPKVLQRRNMTSIDISPSLYPAPRRDEKVVDNYHGTSVTDPYRWMEDPDSEETKKFVGELNAISAPFVKGAPSRDMMLSRLTEMWNFEKYGSTSKRGGFYYYYHNSGLQNQFVLYQQKTLGEKGTVFLDVNAMNSEGTTTSAFSKDGSIFAYGLSEKGSDWVNLKFRMANGTDLPDVITGVKHSSLSFMADNSGIFYCKYPQHTGETEGTSTVKHEYHSLYFHKMGTDCQEDVMVYERRDDPNLMVSGSVPDDGKYLIIDASRGCDPFNMLFYHDLAANGHSITGKIEPVPLFGTLEAKYDYIDHDDNSMLIQTNKDAPMYKLIRVNLKNQADIKEVVPEQKTNKLDWATPVAGNKLILAYLEDVKSTLYVHDLESGKKLYQIPVEIGSVSSFFGRKKETEVFYQFESFLVPGITYRMDFAGITNDQVPEIKELRRISLPGFDEKNFCVEQVFFESKDMTRVPMFIVSNKSIIKDGSNPTILNGYGGFNVADTPYFSVSRLLFVKHFNGVIVCANLRGGSEYGENWHRGGMRENKQNVFDDMIGAAEHLVASKVTRPSKLAIHGGSNGGLLMGACSQQRPDLFGAVINRVGVLDMLRFHKFTIGGAWVPEFGNPDDANDFKFISKYSPLHNIAFPDGKQWPSTLLMTADHDDRVVPSHTLKYAATLYEKAKLHPSQKNPLLARIEVKAGHGAGKPTTKIIEECVDMYSFLQRVLHLTWKE